jgi:ATP-dependent exoDNAse (exonuclease V) beta subunit|tara:strand:+ start:634 stop:1407 length:774 start_codon:yes stop_codon:yes gene_type:complete
MSIVLLKDLNSHIRDKFIRFQEKGHIYYIKREKGYKSVTTIVHNAFEKFNANKVIDNMMKSPKWPESKYYGMTKEEIKQSWKSNASNASNMGTEMHAMFEYYYNKIHQDKIDKHKDTIEYKYFMNFIQDHETLVPYRTEWNVYNEDLKYAGSIDFVVLYDDGSVGIIDWKRCKNIEKSNNFGKRCLIEGLGHIHDSNYWHYTLQLNIYKYTLETKYELSVRDLHLVVIHPENQTNNYEKIKLPIIPTTDIEILLTSV